jgi:hypothetical protein
MFWASGFHPRLFYFIGGFMSINTIKIDDVEYVRKDQISEKAELNSAGLEYKIVRTNSAGVFAGYLKSLKGKQAVILNSRRLWRWAGALTLSELAEQGTSKPSDCKFSCVVSEETLTEAIEILSVSKKGQKSIQGVQEWKL